METFEKIKEAIIKVQPGIDESKIAPGARLQDDLEIATQHHRIIKEPSHGMKMVESTSDTWVCELTPETYDSKLEEGCNRCIGVEHEVKSSANYS